MGIAGIVLAGGASERMGAPKALLRVGDETFLARSIRTLASAGVDRVVVVTGWHHEVTAAALAAVAALCRVQVVRNPAQDADQLSSLVCGLDAVEQAGVSAVIVALVDHPFVSVATAAALIQGFLETRAPVVRPICRGRHGHPVVFARETFGPLHASPVGGAKAVVRAFAARALSVDVEDEGIWTDIDTPADYEAALARFDLPSRGERHA